MISFLIYTQIDPKFVYAISDKNILRHLLFSGNNTVFWSIPPEVQFYAFFILIWVAVQKYKKSSNPLALTIMFFASVLMFVFRENFPGTFVGSKLHFFALGAIAGYVKSNLERVKLNEVLASCLQIILMSLVIYQATLLGYGMMSANIFYAKLSMAILSAITIFALSFASPFARLALGNRMMVFFGECSFSIYLLNVVVLYYFRKILPTGLPVATFYSLNTLGIFLAAWLMYRFIELPGARLIKLLASRLDVNNDQTSKSLLTSVYRKLW